MWWKLYFWIYSVLTVVGIVFVYGNKKLWTFVNFYEVITAVITIIALYAYVYRKNYFSNIVWKTIFWVIIIGHTLEFLYKFTPFNYLSEYLESKDIASGMELLVSTLIVLPLYYAMYTLGHERKVTSGRAKK